MKIGNFGKIIIKYTSTQIFSNILRGLAGILVIRMLNPEEYGIYAGIGVYIGYVFLGNIGIINGFGREFPYQIGKGNEKYGKELADTTFFFTTLVSILASFIFLFFSIYYYFLDYKTLALVFLVNVVVSGFDIPNSHFLPVLYWSNHNFGKISRINVAYNFWNLFSVLFVWLWGFHGLLVRATILPLVQFGLLYHFKPYKVYLRAKIDDFRYLVRTGLPIFIVNQISPLWFTVINNLLFLTGGARPFGYYSLSIITYSTLSMIPSSLGQVIYPRMARMYGEGIKVREIIMKNMKAVYFQLIVMIVLSILAIIVMPYVIPLILPQYTGGIRAAQWIAFVPVINSFGSVNQIYNVVKQQKLLFLFQLIGALVGTAYVLLNNRINGFDMVYFPQGLLIGTVIQQLLSLNFALRLS